jgi:hypothetical protein
MFIAQEPQIPSRHERRKVSVESISFLIYSERARVRVAREKGREGAREVHARERERERRMRERDNNF